MAGLLPHGLSVRIIVAVSRGKPAGALPPERVMRLLEAIDASYDAVVAKLPDKDRPRSG
jgi:hypothetical protein